jgi:hypothetical protein
MNPTKKILAAAIMCGVFASSALAVSGLRTASGSYALIDHSWVIRIFGLPYGLQGYDSITIINLGYLGSREIHPPFFTVVTMLAVALAVIGSFIFYLTTKRKGG